MYYDRTRFQLQFCKDISGTLKRIRDETEMSIHAVDKNMRVENVVIEYRDRPEGSESKLNTYSERMEGAPHNRKTLQKLQTAGILLRLCTSSGGYQHYFHYSGHRNLCAHRPGAQLPRH